MTDQRKAERRQYNRRRPPRDYKMVIFECSRCDVKHHVMRELRITDIQTLQREGWVFPDGPVPDMNYKVGAVRGLCPDHAIEEARG